MLVTLLISKQLNAAFLGLENSQAAVAQAFQRNCTTVDRVDAMLKDAYEQAEQKRTPSAMVSACLGLIKLHRLDAETRCRLETNKPAEDEMTPAEYLKKLATALPH